MTSSYTLIAVSMLLCALGYVAYSAPVPAWQSYKRDWNAPSGASYRKDRPTTTQAPPQGNGNENGE